MRCRTNDKWTPRKLAVAAALGAALSFPMIAAGPQTPDNSGPEGADSGANGQPIQLPDSLTLTGVVRDFRERSVSGGHTDFEWRPDDGFGEYMGLVEDQLDQDHKPVYRSSGFRITTQWRDAQGQNRIPSKEYIASRPGDSNGAARSVPGGALHAASDFAQWFRDVPGVNLSAPLSLTLVRQEGTNIYTFDDKNDPLYQNRGGFFPINGELFGNSAGNNSNFHFTFELNTQFVYRRGTGQVFTFTGDDDVWVFVDGKLVIDIGGVHSAVSQTIDLDRLEWLQDGHRYDLRFFFAERHRTQSNFRIDTTLTLQNAELPSTTALYD